MNFKNLFLSAFLTLGLSGQALATCQADYMEKIDSSILPTSIKFAIDGTALFISGSMLLPLGLELGMWGAEKIRNNPLHDIVRVLDYSEFSATGKFPQLATGFQKEVAVNGQTKDERRAQKRFNRQVRRQNYELARYNKRLTKELIKGLAAFAQFHEAVAQVATDVTPKQLAQAVKASNDANEMCNGKIGTVFGPTIEYKQEIVVDGATEEERKQQEKFNKHVRKHNRDMGKLEWKNLLATKGEIIRYFQEAL